MRPSPLARLTRSGRAWIAAAGVAVAAGGVYFLMTRAPDNSGGGTESVIPPDSIANTKGKSLQTSSEGEKKLPGTDTSGHIALDDRNAGKESKSGKTSIENAGKDAKSGKGLISTEEKKAGKGPNEDIAKKSKSATAENGNDEPAVAPLALELMTNKGSDNPRFTEGDTIRMYIRVNRPCTIRVLYQTADGTLYALTGPNDRHMGTDEINRRVLIESSACSSPFGKESLHAFATSETLARLSTTGGGGEEYCRVLGDPQAALSASRRQPPAAGKGTFAEKEIAILTSAP